MRQDAEFFGEAELPLLYMASRLRDALKVEEVLNAAGVDYLLETGKYISGFLMRRELTGAFFYVTEADVQRAREVLLQNRFKPQSLS